MTPRAVLSLLAAACAGAALAAWAGGAPASQPETVGCSENAQVSSSVRADPRRYRVLLGRAALPRSSFVHEPVRVDGGGAYPYWSKLGLLLRLGSGPVEVRVPAAWRKRVAIGWGYANLHEQGPWVRFQGCLRPRSGRPWSEWLAYPGGVSVAQPACVPLLVSAGGRTTRHELAIGRPCR